MYALFFFSSWTFSEKSTFSAMRIVRNEKILLPVNNILAFSVENTHGTVSNRHGRHSGYYLLSGRVRFRQRESTREANTADTHIPPPRVKTEKKRYTTLPYKQSHPRIYLRQRRRNERSLSSSSFSSSPVTTQTNQCDSLQVINKALLPKTRRQTWPHVDV